MRDKAVVCAATMHADCNHARQHSYTGCRQNNNYVALRLVCTSAVPDEFLWDGMSVGHCADLQACLAGRLQVRDADNPSFQKHGRHLEHYYISLICRK